MANSTHMATTTLRVEGMTCGACTSAIESGFHDMPGVGNVSVSHITERCVIVHDPGLASPELLKETIEDRGFDAEVLSTDTSTPPTAHSAEKSFDKDAHKSDRTDDLRRTTLSIDGMTCGACTSAVESAFEDVDGVKSFSISLLAERCVLVHDPTILPPQQIVEAIEDRGFDAQIISSERAEGAVTTTSSEVQIKVYGISDSAASDDLESLLTSVPGINKASISLKALRASISYDPSAIGLRAIVKHIENAGYNALLAETDDNNAQLESLAKTKEIKSWRRNFRISLAFAIPVFLTSMFFPMFLPFLDYGSIRLRFIPGLWLGDVVCLILTIPVQFGIGKRFYISAGKSIRHGSPTMDVLVVLGTTAAFSFSVAAMCVSIFSTPHTRPATVFDTSTMLITFITFGRYLENAAKSQTSKALSRLMSLAPSTATIYVDPLAAEKSAEDSLLGLEKDPSLLGHDVPDSKSSSAEQETIPTELIQIGDVVVLRPCDKVPADGTIIRGESFIDESMVTGEAMPVWKKVKSPLMAGTVNGAARLDFKVTRAGRDTQLSQIVRLVQEAQTNRAPIQRVADIVAGYFVPIIIALGAITFFGWMFLSHILPHPPQMFLDDASGGKVMVCLKLCISVIVFACPCALGLSTPTAVMVGTGVGAEKGILVKGGAALETATKITHVIFDKTGTLTTGKMSVAEVNWSEQWQEDPSKLLWWKAVGLAELSSEHPIGRTISKAAKEVITGSPHGTLDGSVEQFSVSVGQGISSSVKIASGKSTSTHHVLIGNSNFLRSHGIVVPTNPSSSDSSTAGRFTDGTTLIHTAVDSTFAATVYLADQLKPTAKAAVAALQRMGIPSSIVTGDAEPVALAIASALHISKENVHASANPSKKQSLIRALQDAGETVAMVGDGINDSPALASADIGISLSTGTDVAMEAADIVLMLENDLLSVPAALHLARTIFNRIRLNLLWACGYNVIGLPFAMGVLLPWGYSLHPMAAGAAMAFSSVSVVVSSLCLKFWQRPKWMDAATLDSWDGRSYGARSSRFANVVPALVKRLGWVSRLRRRGRKSGGDGFSADDVVYVPLSNVDEV